MSEYQQGTPKLLCYDGMEQIGLSRMVIIVFPVSDVTFSSYVTGATDLASREDLLVMKVMKSL